MTLLDPETPYGWHDERASWSEIKTALFLAGAVVLGLIVLF
jgi:hypothetical protein